MFEFKMNDRVWHIVEVEQESFWKDDNELEKMNSKEYYFGRTMFDRNVIWLWKEASQEQKRKTLMHELLHCYRGCYVTFNDVNCDEDFWCDMCANSHDIIHDIVERYFETKPISNISIEPKVELYENIVK
jgi:hypothetical protein